MKQIARHLTYANLAAMLALVLAVSSAAVAATGGFASGGKLQACVNGEGSGKAPEGRQEVQEGPNAL